MNKQIFSALLLVTFTVPSYAAPDWSWRYPMPQGHTLNDIVFLDNTTAVAVGEVGTVLITHDTGTSWIVDSKVNGLTTPLKAIDRLDDNSAVVVGDNGVILRSNDHGASWIAMPSGTSASLLDVSFFDFGHGIVVAGTTVLRTTDSGAMWFSATVPVVLRSVDMISPTDAFAVGEMTVMKTTDGGATWVSLQPIFPFPSEAAALNAVDFLDPLHGAIVSASVSNNVPAYCYLTADGGETWSPTVLPFVVFDGDIKPQAVRYQHSGELLVANRAECCHQTPDWQDPWPTGGFAGSVDGGGSWAIRLMNRSANGLAQNSDGIVIVVGDDGRLIRRNLDATYTELGPSQPHALDGGSSFLDASTGIVFSSDGEDWHVGFDTSYFSRTTDSGHTWSMSSRGMFRCLDIACLTPTEVIAVGVRGDQSVVVRSVNGGATWTEIWVGLDPHGLRAVAAGSSTRAIAVGTGFFDASGLIIENGLVTPVDVALGGYEDVAFANQNVVLAVGGWHARSMDAGVSWTPIMGAVPGLHAVDFATSTRAFGISTDGIMRSEDTGDTWALVPSGVAIGLRDISFSGQDHGMAVGDNGLALATWDGGDTWTPLVTPTTRVINNVTMISADHAFVSGLQHAVLEFAQQPVPTFFQSFEIRASSFAAELRWYVTTDQNLAGFTIRRNSGVGSETVASKLPVVTRSYRDDGLTPGQTYAYQVMAVDRNGSYTQSIPVKVTIPKASLELFPNQPNPFNPVTTIRFVVPEKMRVTLSVHDVAGRLVTMLVDDVRDPGVQTITWNAQGLASGVYFAVLRSGKKEVSRKMVLLK